MNMDYRPAFLALILGLVVMTEAGTESPRPQAEMPSSAHQWDVVDLKFPVRSVPQDSIDVSFSAEFISDTGAR